MGVTNHLQVLGWSSKYTLRIAHFTNSPWVWSLEAYVMQKDEFFATETPREVTLTAGGIWGSNDLHSVIMNSKGF